LLYQRDLIFKRAAFAGFFGVVVAVGMQWAAHGITLAPDAEEFETAFIKWVTVAGIVLAILAGLVAIRRYLWVRKVLTRGVLVTGTVVKLESHDVGGRKDAFGRPIANYAYYTTLRYEMHGRERNASLKLPNSGYTYHLVKGGETELMVLDSAPDRPLIRALYLGKVVKGRAVVR
jgi:hypothetical protein